MFMWHVFNRYYNPVPQRIVRQIPGNGKRFTLVQFILLPIQFESFTGPVEDLSLIEYVTLTIY